MPPAACGFLVAVVVYERERRARLPTFRQTPKATTLRPANANVDGSGTAAEDMKFVTTKLPLLPAASEI